MIFLILGGIIGLLLLIIYIRTINRNIKLQGKVIEEQKDIIERERINHKYTKSQMDVYVQSYHQAVDRLHEMAGMKVDVSVKVIEYDLDEILKEISDKGIKNVSNDKLEFLRKIGKNDTDKR